MDFNSYYYMYRLYGRMPHGKIENIIKGWFFICISFDNRTILFLPFSARKFWCEKLNVAACQET